VTVVPRPGALRMVARRTWLFFEELFTPADHWLIPDNYQEDRDDRVAHRTSPTNIGLQLISTLAAYDFGYLSAPAVAISAQNPNSIWIASPWGTGATRELL